ncbi:polysaccharide biosynthesis protein [Photobacterium salinisoli]|uniref:UDP-N-acetylglucosamine 4,6-dehydratase family protein n=1 Tax=Photobacterium salinisoli TaxID=1616783 RepID=UPI000EA3DE27
MPNTTLNIETLLDREQVLPLTSLMSKNITGKNVMITGAGGSIGSELCRQIIRLKPRKLVLFELNEFNLYSIHHDISLQLKNLGLDIPLISALGSVQHQQRAQSLMVKHQVDNLYHAAAYKHVPMLEEEQNIIEGLYNNVFGTLALAKAAIEAKVSHFTLISTDKAVQPINIMGASKRLAELIVQSLAQYQNTTLFTAVRFGNVLNSSGSALPLFKQQILQGGPVTVTHPDATRYFMSIPEAAQLVIQANGMSENGQLFVLDMGKPVKVLTLVERLIQQLHPVNAHHASPEIEIIFTGLRAGEKLEEEPLITENTKRTVHPKIMVLEEKPSPWSELETYLNQLNHYCAETNVESIRSLLRQFMCSQPLTDA